MVRVEVIEGFTLKDYGKLKDIVRKGYDKEGELFVGDTFTCDEDMAKYLTGDNKLNKVVVKVIEVLPKEEPKKAIEKPEIIEKVETKPNKKKTSKK